MVALPPRSDFCRACELPRSPTGSIEELEQYIRDQDAIIAEQQEQIDKLSRAPRLARTLSDALKDSERLILLARINDLTIANNALEFDVRQAVEKLHLVIDTYLDVDPAIFNDNDEASLLRAAAKRGILYIDEVNLLDDHVADVLLDCSAMGVNIVEREGVSVAHPAKFILVGTMNPEEGELRPQLLDRFGLQVSVIGISDVDQRMQIAKNADSFDSDPEGFAIQYQASQEELKEKISQARNMLQEVTMSDDLLRSIASTCIDLGVKTHRAEIVITRTAKTISALEGRKEVMNEDVKKAMQLALAHRMRSKPFEPPNLNKEKLEKSMEKHQKEQLKEQQKDQYRDQSQHQNQKHDQKPQVPDDGQQDKSPNRATEPDEQVYNVGLPIDVSRIDMPRKRDRMARKKTRGRRMNTLALHSRGRYLRQRLPITGKDIAIDATIRAAAPYQKVRSGKNAIIVKSEDLREKERVGKTSAVVLFVVDASGSMGAMKRMEGAKGAVLSMFMDSYQKRDKIGMIAFRGKEAELILPPCSSADLALSRLRELPTGGKTPLCAGLSRGLQILKSELLKDDETKTMMVLISDGRANVGMGGKIRDELLEISGQCKQLGVQTIVIDTEVVENTFMDMRLGYCQEIAENACGKCFPISSLSSKSIYDIVDREQQLLFEKNN